MSLRIYFILIFCTLLSSCEQIAILTTPKIKPEYSKTATVAKAEAEFWKTLHQGEYQNIPNVDKLLTAAYLENPHDPNIAAHIGFLHIWKITERQRTHTADPLITNEIRLSNKYFSDAVALTPNNPIYQGFLGDTQLVEGQIFKNKREEVHGYFRLKRAINAWPEFNYFTAGYPMSQLPANSEHFKEGLEWQWLTLDACAGKRVDRKNPDFSPYMHLETQNGTKRACWNSSIAPYNFEGFFMNMGDMLVKSGDVQTAVIIYKNATLARNYHAWPYRNRLEQRIKNAKENVRYYQQDSHYPDHTILFNSGYGCVACHQA